VDTSREVGLHAFFRELHWVHLKITCKILQAQFRTGVFTKVICGKYSLF